MALPSFARGGKMRGAAALAEHTEDPQDTIDRLAADNIQYAAEIETLRGRLAQADKDLTKARDALVGVAADVRDLVDRSLPKLPPGIFADDPMPADGQPWAAVDGDRYDLPAYLGEEVPS